MRLKDRDSFSSIHCEYFTFFFFFFVLGNKDQHLFDSTASFLLPKEEIVAFLLANIPPVESLCWGVRGKLAVPSEIAA